MELVIPNTVATSPRPVEGNQAKCTEKNIIKIIPTQNVGMEKPSIEPAIMVLLTLLSGLRPA